MKMTDSFKNLLIETAKALKGSTRRLFMARTVKELESGFTCVDAFKLHGRKRSEEHLPNLLTDIKAIVDDQSQTDPQFRNNRLCTRLSAAEARGQLIAQKGYADAELPTAKTIGMKLNDLGYYPQKVAKSRPKKSPSNGRHL